METTDKFIPLADFAWPVTYWYLMAAPWGYAKAEITLDVPGFVDNLEATVASVNMVWEGAIAPAISFLVGLVDGGGYCWKAGQNTARANTNLAGMRFAPPAGVEHGVTVVQHTGHTDRHARRRLFLPGCPASWIDNSGQITPVGAGKLLEHLRGVFAGFSGTVENNPFSWLLAYPEAIRDPMTGFGTPGFRFVQSLRLCSYTVPVPDPTLAP